MKEFWTMTWGAFAALGGWLGWFLGGSDDYATGVLLAVTERRLSSAAGFAGLFRKMLIFAFVGIGHALDVNVIGTGHVLRTAVLFFYLSNEGISLTENAARLGLPVPARLKAVLAQLHDRAEKEEDGHGGA